MGLTAGLALDAFAVGGLVPRARVGVRTEEEVVEAIRAANERREAIVLWGGGTRVGIGDPPERYDVALDLRGLRGIVDHQPADLTVTVRAGTTLAELSEALAAHGQWWPVEAAHPGRATVGGTIASAAGGPARYRYFHPRDWTIGVRAVLGDGTLTRAGGRVVKNVTGYDLTRTYSGSFGTLCAIVEVTLKLTPLPESSLTLRAELPNLAFAFRMGRELARGPLPLDAIAVVTGEVAAPLGSPWTSLYVRLAGNAAAVARLRSAVEERVRCEEVPGDVWARMAALPADAPMSLRGTWPPGGPVDVYPANAVWYPGVEVLHLLDEQGVEHVRTVREAAEGCDGALVVERAPLELRRAVGTWGTSRTPPAIARRLRHLFDPNGVLAPGRVP